MYIYVTLWRLSRLVTSNYVWFKAGIWCTLDFLSKQRYFCCQTSTVLSCRLPNSGGLVKLSWQRLVGCKSAAAFKTVTTAACWLSIIGDLLNLSQQRLPIYWLSSEINHIVNITWGLAYYISDFYLVLYFDIITTRKLNIWLTGKNQISTFYIQKIAIIISRKKWRNFRFHS